MRSEGSDRPNSVPKPRVAFLTLSIAAGGSGGAERQMLTLARELQRSHDVRFFVMRSGDLADTAAADLGVEIHRLGLSDETLRTAPIAYTISLVRAFFRYLRLARSVDVVDAWMASAYGFAALAQPLARVPVLIAGRRSLWATPADRPWRRKAGWVAIRRFDAVVANSAAVAWAAVRQAGVHRDRVHVIRNGIYPPAPPVEGERERLRRSWGVSSDCLVVGSVANYLPGKGLEAVVEVAGRLRAQRPDLRYLLIGEGPLRPTLARRIAELQLEDIVTLHGFHRDAQQLYQGFDFVLHGSEREGLPNVILEAAAWGKPIVATDVGGTAEVVRDRREALLVPARDPAALAAALLELVLNAGLRDKLAGAARLRALAFSPERLAAETAALYAALFARRRRRAGAPRRMLGGTRRPSA